MSLLLDVLADLLSLSAGSLYLFCCRSRLDEYPTEERSLPTSESSS